VRGIDRDAMKNVLSALKEFYIIARMSALRVKFTYLTQRCPLTGKIVHIFRYRNAKEKRVEDDVLAIDPRTGDASLNMIPGSKYPLVPNDPSVTISDYVKLLLKSIPKHILVKYNILWIIKEDDNQ